MIYASNIFPNIFPMIFTVWVASINFFQTNALWSSNRHGTHFFINLFCSWWKRPLYLFFFRAPLYYFYIFVPVSKIYIFSPSLKILVQQGQLRLRRHVHFVTWPFPKIFTYFSLNIRCIGDRHISTVMHIRELTDTYLQRVQNRR